MPKIVLSLPHAIYLWTHWEPSRESGGAARWNMHETLHPKAFNTRGSVCEVDMGASLALSILTYTQGMGGGGLLVKYFVNLACCLDQCHHPPLSYPWDISELFKLIPLCTPHIQWVPKSCWLNLAHTVRAYPFCPLTVPSRVCLLQKILFGGATFLLKTWNMGPWSSPLPVHHKSVHSKRIHCFLCSR